jgi:tellurite methyltransferase
MSGADRDRWDRIYAERGRSLAEPSSFLTASADRVPPAGRALDVAGGSGRHALWLARRGLAVTLADVSPVALGQARAAAEAAGLRLATVEVDLEHQPLPPGPWDLILDFHYLERSLFPAFAAALAPGGLLLFCQPTERNLERHDRPSRRFLLAEGELAGLIAPLPLEVVSLTEGWSDEGRHEARLIARRR